MTKSGVTNARASKGKGKGRPKKPTILKDLVGLIKLPPGEDSVSIIRKLRDCPVSAPEAATLIKAGWTYLDSNDAWCWQEPKTRARYRLADALALVNVCARSRKSGGSR